MRSMRLIGLCLAVVLPIAADAQQAPPSPSAARGESLAKRWCGACHLVQLRLSTIDPPTFSSIANDPSKTPEYLRNFFVTPHKDMPPIQLTPEQIEDLIAYFEVLRDR